ncbi:alpha/beta hydrolase [Lacihabitans sp. LS3-19]|uniref:alpha/beta hydrolase n=1 Tax=Lacihabitans sp. LS3-19 TaxID=2487335 RepID=UPI0020CDE4D8|nr:alpha/beta hydrolase [Lacihabitans sp. LS3-19]MCP9770414.1 alpha/beta hydrolase [Lacihabitans sp. LS3-19]
MKKLAFLLLISSGLFAQNIAKTDTGSINGAAYRIIFPKNWNKKLVMYAHGYEFTGTQPRQSKSPDWIERMKPFTQNGFAVAASDYQFQGLALAQGVDDTEKLRQHFIRTYGQPDSTFIAGHSMGGGVTLATLENFGQFYNGGLPMCPLAGRIYLQTRKEFDLIATFNVLFPGLMPSLKEILTFDANALPSNMGQAFGKAMQIKKAIFAKDSMGVVSFAKHFDLKPDDVSFALAFGENVLRDVVKKSGGNPYDNTNTIYGRFEDNLMMNQKVERIAANVSQSANFSKYDRTGQISKPTIVLHTIYDQLIPADFAIVPYENLIQKNGNQEYYVVKYTSGQGHCNFTPEQTGKAFDALRNWVKTGVKAEAGFVE